MKNVLPLLFFYCLSSLALQGQPDTFRAAYLLPFTHYFGLENGQLAGPAAEQLLKAIAGAQFTLIGEYHGSHQIPQLTKALLPHLYRHGYRHFAVEVGPYSAKILDSLSAEPAATAERLNSMYSHYLASGDIPIPFFDGAEGAEMLATSSRLGFDLWGLDQEYFDAPPLLFDELLRLAEGRPDHREIAAAKAEFDSLFQAVLRKDDEGIPGYRMFKELTEHPVTYKFFSYFSEEEREARQIITALYKSWDIYDRNDYRGGYSHAHRISYIRQNFRHNYSNAKQAAPKVLVQIGALHAAKGYEFGVYDVGNLIFEMARANGTRSCHIYITSRYYYDKGELKDALKERPGHPEAVFRSMGKKEQWALINLQPLQQALAQGQLVLQEGPALNKVKHLAENFDFVVIPPADKDQQENYTTK